MSFLLLSRLPSLKPDQSFTFLHHSFWSTLIIKKLVPLCNVHVHSPCVYERALYECIFRLLCPVPPLVIIFVNEWTLCTVRVCVCECVFCLLHQRSYWALSVLYLKLDTKSMCLFLSVLRCSFLIVVLHRFRLNCNSHSLPLIFEMFVWECESLCLVVTFK